MDKPARQGGRHGRSVFSKKMERKQRQAENTPAMCALQQAFKHVRGSSEFRFKLQQNSSSDSVDDYVFPNKQFESDCTTLTQKIREFSRKLNIEVPQEKPFLSVANLLKFDEALGCYIPQLQKCQSSKALIVSLHGSACFGVISRPPR